MIKVTLYQIQHDRTPTFYLAHIQGIADEAHAAKIASDIVGGEVNIKNVFKVEHDVASHEEAHTWYVQQAFDGNVYAAKQLTMSEWGEERRDLMTPRTIAANHTLDCETCKEGNL